MEEYLEKNLIKIKIPLPANDPSGGEAEWVWAEPVGDDRFVVRNVPTFIYGVSYGDIVRANRVGDALVFQSIVQRGGHSTYRAYVKSDRRNLQVANVLQTLESMHCDIEPATDKIIGIDVLPEADINAVYRVLEEAENSEIIQFEEAHCGHKPDLPVPREFIN
jgi:hypothetical protein